MLKCADGSYYTGHTDNLEQSVSQHQWGAFRDCYTFNKRPVEMAWSEMFATRDDAFAAERQIKGWSRRKKEALINGDWPRVQLLASRSKVLRDGISTLRQAQGSMPPQDERSLLLTAHPEERLSLSKPRLEGPTIILVRPQLGENIGKAARAMLNFGLTELRLVAPRDGWPNPSAGPAAAGADVVLAQAQVFGTLAEATADIAHVYATTVRKRGVTKPVVTPAEAAGAIHSEPGRSAILFGAERSGLDSDELALARTIITVPINPDFGSLNLAQAVIICAYEYSKLQSLESPPKVVLDPPSSQFELDGMIDQLFAMLEPKGYFLEDRAPVTRRTLRSLLTKPAWSAQEVRTIRGVLTTLAKRRDVQD